MTVWVVVDIGCIECGESTSVLGVYRTESEARNRHNEGAYFNGGQHHVEIFEAEVSE